jgi:hypothetical protein
MLGNTTLLQPYTSTMRCCIPTKTSPTKTNSTETYPSGNNFFINLALDKYYVAPCNDNCYTVFCYLRQSCITYNINEHSLLTKRHY